MERRLQIGSNQPAEPSELAGFSGKRNFVATCQPMFPDVFQTDRLVLNYITASDAEPIFNGYAQDAAVTRFLTWCPHRSLDDAVAYVQRCIGAASSQTYVLMGETMKSSLARLTSDKLVRMDLVSVMCWLGQSGDRG